MLLTSAQVAEKLGVSRNYVTNMAKAGKLPSVRGQHPTPSGRTNYGFDAKVVAEFRKTFIPPAPKPPKTVIVKVNGHAPTLPLDIPTSVALDARLINIAGRIDSLEEKIDLLLAAWGVTK